MGSGSISRSDPRVTGSRSTRILSPGSCVAFLLAATAAAQEPPQPDPWASLDEQIEALTASLGEDEPGPWLSGYLMPAYLASDDPVWTTDPKTFEPLGDLSGFEFLSAGLYLEGELGGYEGKVGYNPVSEKLRSTYVRFHPWEPLRMTLGRFKGPLLRSRAIRTTRLLFPFRTVQARQTGPRDEGVKLEWELSKHAEWTFAAQNGADGAGDDLWLTTRLELELVGGGVENYEGAYKADHDPDLTVGLGFAKDQTLADGEYRAADFAFTWQRFSLSGEWVQYPSDEPVLPGQDKIYDIGILDPISRITWTDTNPYDLTASYMLLDDALEVAARIEELDDANHTSRLGFSLNRYLRGHRLKWQAAYFIVDSDLPLLESELLVAGLVIQF